ncbi:MAG: hypothetical protein AB7U63_12970 [Porticoccaceae bacterium]
MSSDSHDVCETDRMSPKQSKTEAVVEDWNLKSIAQPEDGDHFRENDSRNPLVYVAISQIDDPNRPETEEDGIRAEAIRRMKVRGLLRKSGV